MSLAELSSVSQMSNLVKYQDLAALLDYSTAQETWAHFSSVSALRTISSVGYNTKHLSSQQYPCIWFPTVFPFLLLLTDLCCLSVALYWSNTSLRHTCTPGSNVSESYKWQWHSGFSLVILSPHKKLLCLCSGKLPCGLFLSTHSYIYIHCFLATCLVGILGISGVKCSMLFFPHKKRKKKTTKKTLQSRFCGYFKTSNVYINFN